MLLTTENLPEGVTAPMLRRFARADRLAKRYKGTRDKLADQIKAAFAAGDYVFENVIIKRSVSRVTDTSALVEKYTPDTHPEYYKQVLDLSKVPADVKAEFTGQQEKVSVTTA